VAITATTAFSSPDQLYYPSSTSVLETVVHQDYALGYCEDWELPAWVLSVLLLTGVSTATLARLFKDVPVKMDMLVRICDRRNCNVGDMMDIVQDGEESILFNDIKSEVGL